MKILFLVSPRDGGRWVIREYKDGGYDIPHNPNLMPTMISHVMRHFPQYEIKIVDSHLLDLNYNDIKLSVDEINPDLIISFLGVYTVPNDRFCFELSYPTIVVLPEAIDPIELNEVYDIKASYFTKLEIENTVVDGLKEFEIFRDIINTPGFLIRKDHNFIDTGDRPLNDISLLPFPAYDFINVNKYLELQKQMAGTTWVYLYTMRGCPYNCTFCASDKVKMKVRYRTSDQVLEEINYFNYNYGYNTFYFHDG